MLPAVMDSHAPSGNFTHRCNILNNWGIFSLFQINHPDLFVNCFFVCSMFAEFKAIVNHPVAGCWQLLRLPCLRLVSHPQSLPPPVVRPAGGRVKQTSVARGGISIAFLASFFAQ